MDIYYDTETGGLDGKPKITKFAIIGGGSETSLFATSISRIMAKQGEDCEIVSIESDDHKPLHKMRDFNITIDKDYWGGMDDYKAYIPEERSLYGSPKFRNKPNKRDLTPTEFNRRKKKRKQQSKDRHKK